MQDAGPAYRNVVGLPGGVKSPLFKVSATCALGRWAALGSTDGNARTPRMTSGGFPSIEC
eukprot:362561-Chlamydomonas_euryale.AAC.3